MRKRCGGTWRNAAIWEGRKLSHASRMRSLEIVDIKQHSACKRPHIAVAPGLLFGRPGEKNMTSPRNPDDRDARQADPQNAATDPRAAAQQDRTKADHDAL